MLVSSAVVAYLSIVHCTKGRCLPKEAAVGLIFAVGTVLAPFTRAADATVLLLPALLFGLLCWLNCSVIETGEGGRLDAISAWIVSHMKMVVIFTCFLCLLLALKSPGQHSSLALLISAIGFWAFAGEHADQAEQYQSRNDALRVGVDIPLLTPLLLLTMK